MRFSTELSLKLCRNVANYMQYNAIEDFIKQTIFNVVIKVICMRTTMKCGNVALLKETLLHTYKHTYIHRACMHTYSQRHIFIP